MAKNYDVVMKELVERDPAAWLALLDIPTDGPIGVINTDLSTITSDADKILLVESSEPHLVHMEFQSTRDLELAERLLRYNVNIGYNHTRLVQSHAILLHRRADFRKLTGVLEHKIRGKRVLTFEYEVVRAWTLPVEQLLTGHLWVMPLAPLANAPENRVSEIVRRVDSRLSSETEPSTARIIMEMTLVLAGLRLGKDTIQHFRESLKSMTTLKESSYYQLVHGEGLEEGLEKGRKEGLEEGLEKGLEKGKIAEARRILLRLAEVRFGPAGKSTRAAIEAIDELDRLEKMTDRILTAKSWRELIDQSASDRN